MFSKRQSGMTLVEIMVSTLILSIISLTVAQMTSMILASKRTVNLTIVQNTLAAEVRRLIASRSVIIATKNARSADGSRRNPSFHDCICGIGACQSVVEPYLTLFIHQSQEQTISPRFFDENGFDCNPAVTDCAFALTSEYFAQCAPDFAAGSQNPAPQCNGRPAEYVAVRYTVTPSDRIKEVTNGLLTEVRGWHFTDIRRLTLSPGECL